MRYLIDWSPMGTTGAHRQRHNGLVHDAFLYSGVGELSAAITDFVLEGEELAEAALVALPSRHADAVRAALDDAGADATVLDMSALGRNPGRIIPAVTQFVRAQEGPVRFVGEPVWPGRSPAELDEAMRHEALLNLAFERMPVHILCPYDSAQLDRGVLEDAELTHPTVVCDGQRRESARYRGWLAAVKASSRPLADLGRPHAEFDFERDDLSLVRSVVRRQTDRTSLSPERAHALLLAANEAASNSVAHAGAGGGRLRVWPVGEGVICEISDPGHIADPLAGRRKPGLELDHGRGLWLMHQLCDLVEIRTRESRTTVRLHVGTHAGAAATPAG